MIDLVVGFLVEVACEVWHWAKVLGACAAAIAIVLVLPIAVAYLAWVRISALPPGRQLPWAVAALALGACAWRVWRRRTARFLVKLFGED